MDLSKFVRRDISGIRKDILPLSGFGILSHALADEIAARNQVHEGFYRSTEMEFLEDPQPEPPPMMPPAPVRPETVKMDMTLLFKIVQQSRDPAQDTALPAGTRKILERVSAILMTGAQNRPQPVNRVVRPAHEPGNLRQFSAPSVLQPGTDARQTGFAYRQITSRMQNPLRDPKAPVAVEKMRTPSRETARASDHAMLFSDVLRRAQDAGLTFASRQGGVPASAQTRKAYTERVLRQAEAERKAEEEQVPVWQKTPQEVPAKKPPTMAGISPQPDILRDDQAGRKNSPLFAMGYPEAELNFAEEAASPESAERSGMKTSQKPPINPQTAEIAHAMQEAGAKALTEGVVDILRETTIPPNARAVVENLPGKSARSERSAHGAGTAAFVVDPDPQKRPLSASLSEKQVEQTSQKIGRSENHSGTAEQKAVETVRSTAANPKKAVPEEVETVRPVVANTGYVVPASVEITEITQPPVQETLKTPGTPEASRNAATASVEGSRVSAADSPKISRNAAAGFAESIRPAVANVPETNRNLAAEITEPEEQAATAKETPAALSGDRDFAERMSETQMQNNPLFGMGYPEAELNFVEETASPESAELPGMKNFPKSPADPQTVEIARAMQEAGTKALTEGLAEVLREAASRTEPGTQNQTTSTPERRNKAETPVTQKSVAERSGTKEHPGNTSGKISAETMPQIAKPGTSIPPKATPVVENVPGGSGEIPHRGNVVSESAGTTQLPVQETLRTPETPEASRNAATASVERGRVSAADTPEMSRSATMSSTESTRTADANIPETNRNLPAEITEPEEQAATAKEPSAALSGDRDFAEKLSEAQMQNNPLFGVGYPEAELNFAEEVISPENAELPGLRMPQKSPANLQTAEFARAMQEAGAKALTEGVADILREANIPPKATPAVENASDISGGIPHSGNVASESAGTTQLPVQETLKALGTPEVGRNAATASVERSRVSVADTPEMSRSAAMGFAESAQPEDANIPVTNRNLPAGITEPEEQAATSKETSAVLSGDRDFAERMSETQMQNNPLFGVGYPEAELNFAEETASPEGAEIPGMKTSPKSPADPQTVEIARAMQEAGAKALTQGVAEVLREAASRTEPGTQSRTTGTPERRNKAEIPVTQKSVAERSGTTEHFGNTSGKASAETVPQRAGENREKRNLNAETPDLRKNAGSRREDLRPTGSGRMADLRETDAEERIPPLGGETGLPGSVGGREKAERWFRQQGYGTPTLEYRDEEAPAGMPEVPAGSDRESFRRMQNAQEAQIRKAAGEAAQESILWLGRKVAGRAAEEMTRMQRTLPQPGGILRPESRMLPQTQPLHTVVRTSMGDPASARWNPGGQTAAVRPVSPAEMPHLMYQTGKETGDGLPFESGPDAGIHRPQMQVGNPLEVQRAYPALSMEYSSPMSRMEEQIQTAMAQQMSAASRPIGMQTGASQYMAGKASPDSMKTLDQMSPPSVQDQVVWQNPYLRSAPADMTYRSKKKEAPEQPQPSPRPAARMSDAEIHRMADQVFRIVKDKIRQERRKMGL